MTGSRLRVLAAATLLLSSAACGARWSDDQKALVLARDTADQVQTGVARAEGAGGGRTVADPEDQGSGSSPTGPSSGDGSPAPTQAGTGAAAPGNAPCEAPSDAPGVTDDAITVGSISSLSGPVPGLGASAAGAIRAYVAYRNATGGVCGRKIVLNEADDRTDNGQYRAVIAEMSAKVLGITGGFALGDVGGTDVVRQNDLPVVNLPGSEDTAALPTVFDLNPSFENPQAEIGKYRYLREQGARRVAVAYLAVEQSRAEARLQQGLMEAAGLQVVDVNELPLTTLNHDAAARRVANSGADYLWFIGDTASNVSMARAMANTGYELRVAEYFAFAYGTQFVEAAGGDAEGVTTWLRSLPNEEAGSNPELASFLEWMGRAAPGDVPDPFAVDSWVSGKAFFDSLQALPGPITRHDLVAHLATTETFDAGGMYGPIRLGAGVTNGCVVGMQVRNGQWQRLAPAQGFIC